MGEVYRARDTRLGRDVAVKVVPDAVADDPSRLKRFEREARATAALSHPNLLTLLDVGEADGRAYVVFELLEGQTLASRLEPGPLTVSAAVGYAVAIARGLAAAHAKGIVHRDLKPDNVFLTASGGVKVLDFGLARVEVASADGRATTFSEETGPGVRVGTLIYMSPEQAKGLPTDSRSDIFSLGIVLFEMVSGRHPFRRESGAETITAILRDDPPEMAQGGRVPAAYEQVVRRCLEKVPAHRFQSMHDLGLALEALVGDRTSLERRDGGEVRPYPGLASFGEADAAHFFGREAEVAALWEKIRGQKLLAVIGPSGVGKTSFVCAGVAAHRPGGWGVLVCAPGAEPFSSPAQALAPQLSDDAAALSDLIRGVTAAQAGDPAPLVASVGRWRERLGEALLVFDQFEELFTLNPPEVQTRFAEALGSLVDADVHVVLSLRDDFLFRCHSLPPLASVFRDVTPLGPPSREALRRALVEPAARRGVHFEDASLVDQMLDAAGAERGTLPLLAFAVSRLWDERDRERKKLTRDAYERIGGVAGALARHAEETLSRLGPESEGTVREIFRNLVTAAGTRSARDRDELLSVFGERRAEAAIVLDALVGSRLLTEFEAPLVEPGASHRRIEVVHESLLTEWPRLVRWRTQDADGAQLRDQLRQTARLWDERGRPEDLLWTGASYLDYRAWRARYPGGLSGAEEDFARAMAALADRRRRRRRRTLAAVVAVLVVGLGVMASLWSRSETARRKADAEALRAEASKLLAIGQTEYERHPTAALAWATKSLELADTPEARRFALKVLQGGPVAQVIRETSWDGGTFTSFSRNGKWLALGDGRSMQLVGREGGKLRLLADDFPVAPHGYVNGEFGPDSDVLVGAGVGQVRVWTIPEGRELRRVTTSPPGEFQRLFVRGGGFVTSTTAGKSEIVARGSIRAGEAHAIGSLRAAGPMDLNADGTEIAYTLGRNVLVRSLHTWEEPPRLVGTHPAPVEGITFHPSGRFLAAIDRTGTIRFWPTTDSTLRPLRILQGLTHRTQLRFSPHGRWLAALDDLESFDVRIWDLGAPRWAEPLRFRSDATVIDGAAFDSSETWLATGPPVALWPLGASYARVLKKHKEAVIDVAFSRDGATLLTASSDGTVCAWPMSPEDRGSERVLLRTPPYGTRMAVDPAGERVAVTAAGGRVLLVPLSGGPPQELEGFSKLTAVDPVAFSPSGRLVAAASGLGPAADKVVRVWNVVERGAPRVLGPLPGSVDGADGGFRVLSFLDDDRLVAVIVGGGVVLFDMRDGSRKQLSTRGSLSGAVSRREGVVVALRGPPPQLFRIDLEGREMPYRRYGPDWPRVVALDPSETLIATGGADGTVQIGPISGGEPHLLLGHTGPVIGVAFSPDGRWLASGGADNTVRVWRVPNVTRTPFHVRSHDELLATLRSWTNLTVLPDPESSTGWRLSNFDAGPFRGWSTLPSW
jgi:WD40 repeat protein